jgi:hypothetical protein
MPLERPFLYVFKFPFHTNVCMLKLPFQTMINVTILVIFTILISEGYERHRPVAKPLFLHLPQSGVVCPVVVLVPFCGRGF